MNAADKLVELLWSRGRLPISGPSGFMSAAEELFPEECTESATFWVRLMNDLTEGGFIRRSLDGRSVEAERPIMTPLPDSDGDSVVLLGARTQKLLERVEKLSISMGLEVEVEQTTEENSFPTRLILQGDHRGLQAIAQRMEMRLHPSPLAFLLARDHPLIGAYTDSVTFQHSKVRPDMRWFDPKTHKFDGHCPREVNSVGLCKYEQYGVRHEMFRVRNNVGEMEVMASPDVATVKWMLISLSGGALAYDPGKRMLSVPRYCPLPRDLGRALALSSGLQPAVAILPKQEVAKLGGSLSDTEARVYRSIHPVIAQLVSKSIGCPLKDIFLDTSLAPTASTL